MDHVFFLRLGSFLFLLLKFWIEYNRSLPDECADIFRPNQTEPINAPRLALPHWWGFFVDFYMIRVMTLPLTSDRSIFFLLHQTNYARSCLKSMSYTLFESLWVIWTRRWYNKDVSEFFGFHRTSAIIIRKLDKLSHMHSSVTSVTSVT